MNLIVLRNHARKMALPYPSIHHPPHWWVARLEIPLWHCEIILNISKVMIPCITEEVAFTIYASEVFLNVNMVRGQVR